MLQRALIPCLVLLCVPAVATAGPTAQAAKSCSLSQAERGGSTPSTLGATYVTSLSVKNTSCGKGKRVVRAYHSCRGSKMACKKKVMGFKCRQKTLATSPLQYDAKVTCKKGGKRVKHTYTQNT